MLTRATEQQIVHDRHETKRTEAARNMRIGYEVNLLEARGARKKRVDDVDVQVR
jgi:hypothetical protein